MVTTEKVPQATSRVSGMDFSINPSLWQCTDPILPSLQYCWQGDNIVSLCNIVDIEKILLTVASFLPSCSKLDCRLHPVRLVNVSEEISCQHGNQLPQRQNERDLFQIKSWNSFNHSLHFLVRSICEATWSILIFFLKLRRFRSSFIFSLTNR